MGDYNRSTREVIAASFSPETADALNKHIENNKGFGISFAKPFMFYFILMTVLFFLYIFLAGIFFSHTRYEEGNSSAQGKCA